MTDEPPAGPPRPFGVPHRDASVHDIARQLAVIAFWMRFFGIVTIVAIVIAAIGVFVALT